MMSHVEASGGVVRASAAALKFNLDLDLLLVLQVPSCACFLPGRHARLTPAL